MFRLIELKPALLPACARIIREEWPKITEEWLHEVVTEGHDDSGFPCSLVMVQNQQLMSTEVIAHCRFSKLLNYPNSAYMEKVVVDKSRRGKGLGRELLNLAEDYAKSRGFTHIFVVCLTPSRPIFLQNGYLYCEPNIVALGSAMLGSTGPPPYVAPIPGREYLHLGKSDLIKDGGLDEVNSSGLDDDSIKHMLKIKNVKLYDSLTPELSLNEYACLAKKLS